VRSEADRHPTTSRDPAFLIVGTPRSGTTLVQRLACSLQGVRVPPETHYRSFVKSQLRTRRFPMDEPALRETLRSYAERKIAKDVPLDADAVVRDLGGRCDDPWQLFAALIRQFAGPADLYGEKTPEHVRWWRPMTAHFPALRLVAVVRDPRAVVASNLGVPFGPTSHLFLAERWRVDQTYVLAARDALGAGRCLVLRYEDVVADPDDTRARIGSLLGVDPAVQAEVDPAQMHHAWEWWKARASQPITSDRVESWRDVLSSSQAADVAAICRSPMRAFGYKAPAALRAIARQVGFPPREQRRRLRYRGDVRRELAWAESL
jgi:hypothetical protein